MRFFDSNVLVAGAFEDHDRFEDAQAILESARKKGDGATSAHALAETYAVLTGQSRNRFPPDAASRYVDDVSSYLKVVALSGAEMVALLRNLGALGVAGGRVYDAIHARAAAKSGASRFVTWNRKDFAGLEPGLAIEAPQATR